KKPPKVSRVARYRRRREAGQPGPCSTRMFGVRLAQPRHRVAVLGHRALDRERVEGVGDGASGGGAGNRLAFPRRLAGAALDVFVVDAVAAVDPVVAAVAVEAVFAGLAKDAVGAMVADQDVVVEGALHVLVGGR